jgi:hypothetical protein
MLRWIVADSASVSGSLMAAELEPAREKTARENGET